MTKRDEEVLQELIGAVRRGEKDDACLYTFVNDAVAARDKEVRLTIEECGHQQEDDTIWCNMDDLLTRLLAKEN